MRLFIYIVIIPILLGFYLGMFGYALEILGMKDWIGYIFYILPMILLIMLYWVEVCRLEL